MLKKLKISKKSLLLSSAIFIVGLVLDSLESIQDEEETREIVREEIEAYHEQYPSA